MLLLKDKVALITGGSKGIGRATANLYAEEGAKVVINARSQDVLEQASAQIRAMGGECIGVAGDLSAPCTSELLYQKTMERFGRLDIVVSNVGTIDRTPTLEMDFDDWNRVIDTNLTAGMRLAVVALRHFKDNGGGRLIFISSDMAKTVHRNSSPAYGCSKAAIGYLIKHLAVEFAQYHVTVNAVLPGLIETDMIKNMTSEARKGLIGNTPLGRIGRPEDIAGGCLYLACKYGDYITGECIDINGGYHMD